MFELLSCIMDKYFSFILIGDGRDERQDAIIKYIRSKNGTVLSYADIEWFIKDIESYAKSHDSAYEMKKLITSSENRNKIFNFIIVDELDVPFAGVTIKKV